MREPGFPRSLEKPQEKRTRRNIVGDTETLTSLGIPQEKGALLACWGLWLGAGGGALKSRGRRREPSFFLLRWRRPQWLSDRTGDVAEQWRVAAWMSWQSSHGFRRGAESPWERTGEECMRSRVLGRLGNFIEHWMPKQGEAGTSLFPVFSLYQPPPSPLYCTVRKA